MTMSSAGTMLTSSGNQASQGRCPGRSAASRDGQDGRDHDQAGAGAGQPHEVALVGQRVDRHVEPGQPEGRAGQPEEGRQPGQHRPVRQRPGVHEHRRGEAERDQVGEGVELQAERRGRPDSRATQPSAMSSTIETAMSAAATVKCPSKASSTDEKPHIMFSVVKALGARQPGPLALGQLAQRDDPRARGRDQPPAFERCGGGRGRRRRAHGVTVHDGSAPAAGDDGLARHGPVTGGDDAARTSGGTKTSIREPNFIRPIR